MEWTGEATIERGVSERRFEREVEGRKVPGLFWAPESGEVEGLLLLGHGGSLDKRADYLLAVARRAARHHRFASLSIDGPGHGERREDPSAPQRPDEFDRTWSRPEVSDEIVADWRACLDDALELVGDVPVGYFGLSMGTMMGLPLVAAEPRIHAAVLGLMGSTGPNWERLRDDAPRVSCPVRFLVQWDDEVVPRDSALDLFDRLGSKRKELRAHPGIHIAVPPEEMRDVARYLAAELA